VRRGDAFVIALGSVHKLKESTVFEYQGIQYKILSRGSRRWTNCGHATLVFAVNTTTGLGGRNFDINDAGQPYRFSPD
jgi:hypothetical protein